MKVLMVENNSESAHSVAELLKSSGHSVYSCHDASAIGGLGACVALQYQQCPMNLAPMDLFLDVRSPDGTHSGIEALLMEEGVLCAARRKIPVVIAGEIDNQPFKRWAAIEHPGLPSVAALEDVASAPLPDHSAVATAALRSILRAHGITVDKAEAEVRRRDGGILLHIDFSPSTDASAAQAVAIKVGQAVRQIDPWAPSLDITLSSSSS
ncbi:MAG: hypothetical protein ACSLFB_07115 [Acidimicrobiales bacterium]